MPLTPADVHNVAFSKPPISKRGYNEDEVDAFLDIVEAELRRLIEERNDLRNQVEKLDRQLRAAKVSAGTNLRPAPSQPPQTKKQTPPDDTQHLQTAKVLGMAQEIADRLTGEAKTEADGMLGKARTKAEQLLADARAKAGSMVDEARIRAETVLNDARTKAEILGRQSLEKAASLEREATRKHTEIIGSISREKNALEKRIAELRAFEREYHSRLRAYVESQLTALDSHGPTEPADIPSQRGFGTHRADPEIDTAGTNEVHAARPSARKAADLSGTPWKPAVELGRVEAQDAMPWEPIQRSIS
jgi:DivIVA domain-containing protein